MYMLIQGAPLNATFHPLVWCTAKIFATQHPYLAYIAQKITNDGVTNAGVFVALPSKDARSVSRRRQATTLRWPQVFFAFNDEILRLFPLNAQGNLKHWELPLL